MNRLRGSELLASIARIHVGAERSHDGQRCLVAPSPDLAATIKADFARLRKSAPPVLQRLLRARDKNRVGFNDSLVVPGSHFPVGTPAHVVRSATARALLHGVLNVVVVLVDFDDEQFGSSHDQQYYEDLFFSEGVLSQGSVREYYTEVSDGKVELTGEVVGPYRMPRDLSEYANGDSGTGSATPNARTLARDAAEAANVDVDFGAYDNDGDGFVDAYVIVQAGPGAESTGDSDHIWSHKWVLPSVYAADGTSLYAYLVVPEEARIGVCAHEIGHLLFGFPDLYDTDYSSEGVGDWCLMGGGSWNGGGNVPAHPSAWCKANQEWVSVVNVTSNGVESIADVKASNTVYRLWKDGSASDEYFLVENRQRTGFDAQLPGDGLLIWHIDDAVSSNADETHPKVALLQADGSQDLENGNNRGDGGDPFPGGSSNTTFNDGSNPDSKSYGDMKTCVAVESIGASGAVMTALLKVKCAIKKELISEKNWRKEFLKDRTKDVMKDLIKERLKEVTKEKEKEKEFKEFKEFKEYKELKEKDKEKDIYEGPAGGPAAKGHEDCSMAGAQPSSVEARLAAIEQQLAAITPFIEAELRPDLRKRAPRGESDVERTHQELVKRSEEAKKTRQRPKSRKKKD